jgi:hypothetical protein
VMFRCFWQFFLRPTGRKKTYRGYDIRDLRNVR